MPDVLDGNLDVPWSILETHHGNVARSPATPVHFTVVDDFDGGLERTARQTLEEARRACDDQAPCNSILQPNQATEATRDERVVLSFALRNALFASARARC